MCKISRREKPMPLEGCEGDFCGELSYAAAFARALLNPDLATPTAVAGPKSKAAVKRYNVYRNNVTVSLINAVAAAFPATLRITGVDFFRAMARFYVRATPPSSPLLFEYGREFPDFIERCEYAQSVPWLADVARIERAWLDAYHAVDVQPLMPRDLAAIPSERLANTVLKPHPATHAQPILDGISKAIEGVKSFRDKPIGPLRLSMSRPAAWSIVAPPIVHRLANETTRGPRACVARC
jgi:hypothetical protein